MPSMRNTPEFQAKLHEIKTKLMGNPSAAELQAMQLHISTLDHLAQVSADERDHEHNDVFHCPVTDVAQKVVQNKAP